ncbi:zinc finger protein chinmo-like isoform X1 [Tribolium madens]|uniref:zinc finger protein chinmo-like isoform X1 n=2 Tax=Tribolium madens TaxID=41895 RepID=UPI001CF74164|nr:zinc finger protein chinmo-like isoform X1 [Tribolium madens]
MEMRAHNIFHSGVEMDSQQQQFCLKWNSFGTNLATSFSNLFKSETLADVTLFCDGVTFKAHKLILAACSKHLADLFETSPPHQNLIIILDGTSASNMSALLEFMYKGEVHVSQDCLSSFLKAAECLQVKGLSIEHEKLAVAQSHMDTTLDTPRKHLKVLKEEMDTSSSQQQSSPSPSYSPAMSPYMHPHHYRQYEQRMPATGAAFESAMKRPLRSPSETLHERASVLRDGSKTAGRPGSPHGPLSLAFRPSLPLQPEADAPPENRFDPDPATAVVCPESNTSECCQDSGCAEDLRMKMEPAIQQDEPPNSTSGSSGGISNNGSANGSLGQINKYDHERDKDLVPASLWNSVAGKLSHKSGTVNTPDGKKLKCPFCERLYGYETNLRAHIRQRHQGIRVPCPFCSRTFTRNNTVRRHIAREHKAELSLKAFQNQQQQVHNHNP